MGLSVEVKWAGGRRFSWATGEATIAIDGSKGVRRLSYPRGFHQDKA